MPRPYKAGAAFPAAVARAAVAERRRPHSAGSTVQVFRSYFAYSPGPANTETAHAKKFAVNLAAGYDRQPGAGERRAAGGGVYGPLGSPQIPRARHLVDFSGSLTRRRRNDGRRNLAGSAGSRGRSYARLAAASARAELTTRTPRAVLMPHHRVVLVVTVMATVMTGRLAEHEAGEKDNGDDEDDAGDNGDPRSGQKGFGGLVDDGLYFAFAGGCCG